MKNLTRLKRILRKKRVKTVLVLMLVAVIALGWLVFFNGAAHRDTTIVVPRGASVSSVAQTLAQHDLIDSVGVFKLAVRIQGGRIQSGEYEIPRSASAWRVAKMLTRGDIATISVVIPEGLTIQQIRLQLLANAALTGAADCDSLAPVCNLHDGDIFPDTYYVAAGTARLAVLELARKKMVSVREKFDGRRLPRPLENWNDVVTLASIVQKETPKESEMPIVASVYLNRLNKNMRLQADPTVVYALTDGLGDMRGAPLLRGHLKIDSAYNTYRNAGLPPAPIANVGQAAIRAVLKPADTNYLFFVADGRGGHKFANSYEEHQKNHADWREIKKIKNKN